MFIETIEILLLRKIQNVLLFNITKYNGYKLTVKLTLIIVMIIIKEKLLISDFK
jgi:hypothetical protein